MRRENDFYETRRSSDIASLLKYLHPCGRFQENVILEACSGDGAISDFLKAYGANVITNDLHKPADYSYDATGSRIKNLKFDWVITNPPYNLAYQILQNFYGVCNIALLLRLSFLEPTHEREEFLSLHPPRIIVLPRYSYTGNGKSDSVTSAWMIWDGTTPTVHIERKYR